MATARVAGRYAKALLSLAQERKELDEVGKDLDTLEALFEQSRDLVALLDPTGEFDFLLCRDQIHTADFLKVFVEGCGLPVGDLLRDF